MLKLALQLAMSLQSIVNKSLKKQDILFFRLTFV